MALTRSDAVGSMVAVLADDDLNLRGLLPSAEGAVPTVILDEPLSDESTSLLLYGNFIELVYGQQIDSLWTKMQDDRSLEALTKTSGGYWDFVSGFRGAPASMLEIAGGDADLVARREPSGGTRETPQSNTNTQAALASGPASFKICAAWSLAASTNCIVPGIWTWIWEHGDGKVRQMEPRFLW